MPSGVPGVVVTQPSKPWWCSRTLWFNLVVAGLAAAEGTFAVLQPLLPGMVFQVLTFTLVVGNALLRAITSKGLTL